MTNNATSEQRITELAQSLKKMHLAASIEEAYARAKEILGAPKTAEDRSVQEMANDITSLRQELDATKDSIAVDEKEHSAKAQEGADIAQSISSAQESLEEAKKEVERIDAELVALQSKLDKKKA